MKLGAEIRPSCGGIGPRLRRVLISFCLIRWLCIRWPDHIFSEFQVWKKQCITCLKILVSDMSKISTFSNIRLLEHLSVCFWRFVSFMCRQVFLVYLLNTKLVAVLHFFINKKTKTAATLEYFFFFFDPRRQNPTIWNFEPFLSAAWRLQQGEMEW